MANPTCSQAELITNAAGYTDFQLDPKQRKCLLLLAKAYELAGIGGTDYTAVLDTTLVSAAQTLAGFMSCDQVLAAMIQLHFNNATAAGASVPATIALKLAAIDRLVLLDDKTLENIDLLLTCNLGVHKAYPQ